jgi:selenide, water dikinase
LVASALGARGLVEFARELEPNRHADEHPDPGLLGDQRPQIAHAVGWIFPRRGLANRLVVSAVEPAALLEGNGKHPLERGRRAHHHVLRLPEPGRVGDRGDRGVELGVGVGPIWHSVHDHTYVAVPLTSLSHGAGCGCKLPAAAIGPLLAGLPATADPNVIVGFQTSDDAGVYRLRDDLALVQTVDFFTPIVDDPFDFGRIAATNALSDIYAMGATPVSALNLVAFSLAELGEEILLEILRGGGAVAAEAGVAIVGGHSIEDAEPKFGMAVTGVVHPDEVITNASGQPGDALVLTKPLGSGAVSTAVKRGLPGAPLREAVEVMTTLNRDAAAAARAAGVHAMTDVTGFGLLGHLGELVAASAVAAEVEAAAVPAIAGVLELLADAEERAIAGGTRRNRAHAEEFTTFAADVPEARRWLVCDAMTSGGLLAAVPAERATELPGAVIGRLTAGPAGTISVR